MSTMDTYRASGQVLISRRPDVRPAHKVPRSAAMTILVWIEKLLQRRRSRLALLAMTDDQLKDIGLSRADAYHEGSRPFWE